MHIMASRARSVIQDRHRDSTQWDAFPPRPDDIVIASCYKSGTTLTQQIVNLLLNGTRDFARFKDLTPWVDSIALHPGAEAIEALPSPRFLKSHLPFEALPYHETWRYIYLARDGRDVCLSLFDHCQRLKENRPFDADGKPFDYGSDDFSRFWDEWVESGHPYWPLWDHVASWWRVRQLPNVLLLHFDALVGDKPNQIRRVAEFLGRPCTKEIVALVCEGSSLEHMKRLERAGKLGAPGPKQQATFVHKGVNGRWRGRLSQAQVKRYLQLLGERFEPECIDWLRSDGAPATPPTTNGS